MSLTPAYSDDGCLYPWTIEQHVAPLWDRYAQDLRFRVYTHGKSNSKTKAAHRLSYILKDNAALLHGSRFTDLDLLCDEFISQLGGALEYIKTQGIDRVNLQTGEEFNARLTFWTFCRDLKNVHMLCNAYTGKSAVDDIVDLNRRKAKAALLREFGNDCKNYAAQFAYISGSKKDSNQRLEASLDVARHHIENALEDLGWEKG